MAIDERAVAIRDESYNTALANREDATSALTHYLGTGDLSRLSGEQKAALYLDTCHSLNLNPRTLPFNWIEFWDPETKSKKLTLYPNRSCAEQLRRQHQIRVRIVKEEIVGKLFKVVVEGTRPNGVTDEATAYVPLTDKDGNALVGQRLANAFMKGQTAAKRRLTFSMVGMFAPPEMEDLQQARVVILDRTGSVIDKPTQEQLALAADPLLAQVLGEPSFENDGDRAASPLAGHASQAPTLDELTPPARSGPRVSLRCDANRWRAAYFGATADTDLETAEGRRKFLAGYTANYTPALRTDSLSTFLARATDSQAEEMVAAARQAADMARLTAVAEAREGEPDDVEDGKDDNEFALPARPDPSTDYTRPQVLKMWSDWANAMRRLEGEYAFPDVTRLKTTELAHELGRLIVAVEDLHAGGGEAEDDQVTNKSAPAF